MKKKDVVLKVLFKDGAEFGFDRAKNKMEKRIAELEKENAELELKIKCLTRQLKLQTVTELFEQVEEEVKQEQRLNELEAQIEKMRNFQNCDYQLHIVDCPIFKNDGHISCKKCPHWILQEVSE